MSKRGLCVEIRFVPTDEGGRRTSVNLSDGRYRPVVVLGTHATNPTPARSEAEAVERGIFGITLSGGPSEVPPGGVARATLSVIFYEDAYERLVKQPEFTIVEGARVVAYGRVVSDDE